MFWQEKSRKGDYASTRCEPHCKEIEWPPFAKREIGEFTKYLVYTYFDGIPQIK